MNEPYAEVGRVVTEAQAIEEAFRQILRANFPSARRALAQAQRDHYGLKPYKPGFPVLDALDDQMVYKDENGFRFLVKKPQPNGSHIRVMLALPGHPDEQRHFEAWGREATEAARLGLLHGAESPELAAKYTDSHTYDGFIVLRYEYTRAPLD